MDLDAYLRERVTRILDDHENEKAEILSQIADSISVKDHEEKLQQHQALMETKEKQLQEKFEKERLELKAEYSQIILKLQKELLSHQRVKYDLTALGTVKLLQARGFVISSCKRCLGLLIPCRHVRPVERDDRVVQENDDDVEIYPDVHANHHELIASPNGLMGDSGLSNVMRRDIHEIRDVQHEVQVAEDEHNRSRQRRDTDSTRSARGCGPRAEALRTPPSSEDGNNDR